MKRIILIITTLLFLSSCSSSKQSKNNKLVFYPSENIGHIKNRNNLYSKLSSLTNKNIDSTKSLVIIYYPGKDKCNSSGTSARSSVKTWYNDMERRINRISKSNILYIYKDKTGLEGRNDGYKKWFKDPNNYLEKLFFKDNPYCDAFILISKNGNFLSCRSEYSKNFLLKRFKYLTK